MKRKTFCLSVISLSGIALLSSCQTPGAPSSSASGFSSSPQSQSSVSETTSHTEDEVAAYMANLAKQSVSNHLYYHYYRYGNEAADYSNWDLWVWAYRPVAGEGAKFDWAGRTTSSDYLSASGTAQIDSFGGAYADIDLSATYQGGWKAASHTMGGSSVKYTDATGEIDQEIGVQIVYSSSRTSSSGFWKNDGGNQYWTLKDFALKNSDGTTSYHIFAIQDKAKEATPLPGGRSASDPFQKDDGTNVTYGNSAYVNAVWTDKPRQATSPMFLKGTSGGAEAKEGHAALSQGAGIGYQIMVSSFADSDGDGFGDIYGIDQKLDYLKDLGVNVLWLTPIQMSDSYHGYDISDYTQVDPKFASSVSPNAIEGSVSAKTAMEDYKLLLKDAHAKGMAVVMDLVLNHTSTSNIWFSGSAQLDPSYRGYYQWGNHETQSTIKEENSWYPYGDHVYSYYAKFGSAMPELNYSYQATRDAVAAVAKDWCALGVDGFRMDAVKHIFLNDEVTADSGDTIILDKSTLNGKTLDYSSNLTKNLNFWKELAYDVKSAYPNAFFLGENYDGHAYHVAPFYEGFDSLFDFYTYFNMTEAAAHGRNSAIGKGVRLYDGAVSGDSYVNSLEGDKDPETGLASSAASITYGGSWDLKGVFSANNKYRSGNDIASTGFSFINGAFTSNHDISRCLNRVAGKSVDGLFQQGTITDENYAENLRSATCAEIAELMLPGCSWIYYGDELGMSGNFAKGITSDKDSYADLAYRQPMKWKQDGQIGDGSYTTGYSITGSGTGTKWDAINASSLVPSVETASTNDHFKAIRAFAKAKSTLPALIRGTYAAYGWDDAAEPDNVFNVVRTLDGVSYNIVVNFSASQTLKPGTTNLVASYGNVVKGTSQTTIGPLSAALFKL